MVLKGGVFSFGLKQWVSSLKLMERPWIFLLLNRKRYVQLPIIPDMHINTSVIVEEHTNYISNRLNDSGNSPSKFRNPHRHGIK
jgi:hypothetical protein